jgi:hypothetical protein
VDGYKYHGGKQEFRELRETLREVMRFIGVFTFYRVKYVGCAENTHE